MIIEKDNLLLKKIITILVVISPIISPYNSGVPFLLLPEMIFMLFIPVILYELLRNPNMNKLNYIHASMLFYFLMISLSIIANFYEPSFSIIEYSKSLVRMGYYFLLIILISKNIFIFKYGMYLYESLAIIASIYLLIQTMSYKIFNYIMPWYIKWIPMHSDTYKNADFELLFSNFFRPSSFFIEPAHFAQYVLPVLLFLLTYNKTNTLKKIFKSLLITIALIFSTSGTGIILSILIWIIWAIRNLTIKNSKKIVMLTIAILILFIPFVLENSNTIISSIKRLSLDNPMSSSNIRIVRGFVVYSGMPLFEKIFGIGYGNYGMYVTFNNVVTRYDLIGNKTWVNVAAYVLTGTGLLGFMSLLYMLTRFLKKTKGFFKFRTLFLILSLFFSDEFTTISIILTFCILFEGVYQDKIEENNEVKKSENFICY